MHDSIADHVYTVLVEHTGASVKKLNPATTLSRDLGIEGDDAIEFFEAFRNAFCVDLARLDQDWHCYFGSEGVGFLTIIIVLAPPFVLAYGMQKLFSGWPFWPPLIAAVIVWVAVMSVRQRFVWKSRPQISVQDLVDCAKVGRWTKTLPGRVRDRCARYAQYGGVWRWFAS